VSFFHVLPAAGSATRIGGLPKYLLPLGRSAKPLLFFHLRMAEQNHCPTILVVHPSLLTYVSDLCSSWSFKNLRLEEFVSTSMTETCLYAARELSGEDVVSISMPDTFFSEMTEGTSFNPLQNFQGKAPALALWEIQKSQLGKLGQVLIEKDSGRVLEMVDKDENCTHDKSWGMLSLKVSLLRQFPVTDSHPGISLAKALKAGLSINSIFLPGRYWDCGTPEEYSVALQLSLKGEKN
jgi:hypothetical protein